ncbi:histidine phosphatase family protein [Loigolactobacillus iwatensis]|uniref:histidine phosphatase family protein n=1 Tax=Loigolactobacillus iwatensis TaxID=1267156 RepID=UPI000F7E9DE9|nr:histidine phosphatase family protein [Loigolactobacillus iwatensis]
MKSIAIYLVRHGETYFNVFGYFQGWSDTPLTPKGIQQVTRTGQQLSGQTFALAFSSDVGRAIQTGQIIAQQFQQKAPVITPLLREHFYGSFEGQEITRTWQKIARQHRCQNYSDLVQTYSIDRAQDFLSQADPTNLAESSQQFWLRFNQGLELIFKQAVSGAQVLLISHSSVIRALVAKYAPTLLTQLTPANAAVTKLVLTGETKIQTVQVSYYNRAVD